MRGCPRPGGLTLFADRLRLGRYLRALRIAHGLDPAGAARLTRGLPQPLTASGIVRIEKGLAPVTIGRLLSLARLYRVRPAILLARCECGDEAGGEPQVKDHQAWPAGRMLDMARSAGLAGLWGRALRLYEAVELRALEGAADAEAHASARLGVARALTEAGRARLARDLVGDLLEQPLSASTRCWALAFYCANSQWLGFHTVASAVLERLRRLAGSCPGPVGAWIRALQATALARSGPVDRQIESWLVALEAAREAAAPTLTCNAQLNLADCELRREHWSSARDWADRVAESAEDLGTLRFKIEALVGRSRIERHTGETRLAREMLHRAADLARRFRYHALSTEIHADLFVLASATAREAEADEHLHAVAHHARFIDVLPVEARALVPVLAARGLPLAGKPELPAD